MYITVNVTRKIGTNEYGEDVYESVDGYHIDSVIDHNELADYQVTPVSPMHAIAGATTYRYKFADEAQARELMPQAFISELI